MAYSAQAINQAKVTISRATQLDVEYQGGEWFLLGNRGLSGRQRWKAQAAQQTSFNAVLDRIQTDIDAGRPIPAPRQQAGGHARAGSGGGGGAGGIGGFGGGVSIAGGLAGGVLALPERAVGVAVGGIRTIFGVASSVARTTAATVVGLGLTVVGALAGITRATNNFGREIRDFQGVSGLRAGGAAGVVSQFNAVGVRNAGGLDQNAGMFGMRASAYGVKNYTDSRFIESLAGRYQGMQSQGMMGQMMSRQMLSGLGLDSPEMRRVLSMPLSQIREQQSFSNRVQGAAGMDPEKIAEVSRNWDAFTNKLSVFSNVVLARMGQEALPRLTGALDIGIETLSNFSGGIISTLVGGVRNGLIALDTFGQFMAVDVPRYAIAGARTGLEALAAAADAAPNLWQRLLDVIAGGEDIFNRVRDALQSLYDSPMVQAAIKVGMPLQQWGKETAENAGVPNNGASDVVGAITPTIVGGLALRTLRGLFGGGGGAAGGGGAGGGGLIRPLSGLRGALGFFMGTPNGSLGTATGRGILSALGRGPIGLGIGAGLLGYTGMQRAGWLGKDAPGAMEAMGNVWARLTGGEVTQQNGYTESVNAETARRAQLAKMPDLGRSGWARSAEGFAGDRVRRGAAELGSWSRNGLSRLNELEAGLGSEESPIKQMLAKLDKLEKLDGIERNTKATAENTRQQVTDMMQWGEIVARSASYQAQDAFLTNTRR